MRYGGCWVRWERTDQISSALDDELPLRRDAGGDSLSPAALAAGRQALAHAEDRQGRRRAPLPQREGARAGNGLDATPTDALVPQLETGKINCVRLPCMAGCHPVRARDNARSD